MLTRTLERLARLRIPPEKALRYLDAALAQGTALAAARHPLRSFARR